MSEYEQIKLLYKSLEENDTNSRFILTDNSSFSEFVKIIYHTISKENYAEDITKTINTMNLDQDKLDSLILEVIFLNLYENISLISQKLQAYGMKLSIILDTFSSKFLN